MQSFQPQDVTSSQQSGWDDYFAMLAKSSDPSILNSLTGREQEVINYRNSKGDNVIALLVSANNILMLKPLLAGLQKFSSDIGINASNSQGNTPLHRAAYTDNVELVELLLQAGANPNARNYNGRTPGHNAAFKGYAEILNKLLEYGLDLQAATKKGETVLDSAQKNRLDYVDGKFILTSMPPPSPTNLSAIPSSSGGANLTSISTRLDQIETKLDQCLANQARILELLTNKQ